MRLLIQIVALHATPALLLSLLVNGLFSGNSPTWNKRLGAGAAPARSHAQMPGGAVGRASMEIAARGGHRSMPERGLHQMDRCAPAETMAGVRVSQPMGRQVGAKPGPLVRSLHHPLRRARVGCASRGSPGALLATG